MTNIGHRSLFFNRELEKRQNLEVEKRQQQTEVKSLRNTVQQLESDIRDLKRALAEEQDTRAAHGELLDEERRKNDALMEETRHHSQQKTEALYQLEAVDKTRKSYEESSGSLREELKAALVKINELITYLWGSLLHFASRLVHNQPIRGKTKNQ